MTTPLKPVSQSVVPGPENGAKRCGTDRPAAPTDPETLDRICSEMESLFVNHLLKEMRNTIPEDGLVGRSPARDITTSMLDAELARTLSDGGGIGLAEVLKRQLSQALTADSQPESGTPGKSN